MRSVDLLKGGLVGLDLVFGAFSLTLMVVCLWNLSSHHDLLFLLPRGLLFGGLVLGPLGIFTSWMAARGTSAAFSMNAGAEGAPLAAEELIKACRDAGQSLITASMLTVLSVAFSAMLFAFGRVQTLDMDALWDGAASADLFRIQAWAGCCGFLGVDDRAQLPCRGSVGCQAAMAGLWRRVGTALQTPALGMLVAGSLVALASLLFSCKQRERAERRRIRLFHQQQQLASTDDADPKQHHHQKSLFQ
jgi:hypothetical protein